MKLDFDGTFLDTDYHDSQDFERGLPWCLVQSSTWHILLPRSAPQRVDTLRAYPVIDRAEPDHWRWRIEIGTWCLPIYRRCIRPFRPGFPRRGTKFDRAAVLYSSYRPAVSGSSFFGTVPLGWQTTNHSLVLVRR